VLSLIRGRWSWGLLGMGKGTAPRLTGNRSTGRIRLMGSTRRRVAQHPLKGPRIPVLEDEP